MKRVGVITLFLIRVLSRSLLGLAPLATMLGAYTVTFFYQGNKVDYFAAVGGFDLALVCVVTTLVFATQASRAASYPLLARLPRRAELLAAVLLASFIITCLMAALFTVLAAVQRTAEFTLPELMIILPRWFALFAFAAGLALNLSKLVSTPVSRVVITLLLIVVLVAGDRQLSMQQSGLGWLLDGAGVLAAPLVANMMVAVHGATLGSYVLAVLLPVIAAAVLCGLATLLFRRKDLLWVE